MQRTALLAASILGGLGVGLGAFGAHALEPTLIANDHVDTYETGTLYHLVHAVLLLGIGILLGQQSGKYLNLAVWTCTIGILIFSGTLYILSIFNLNWLGVVTPLGGLLLIATWVLLLLHVFSLPKERKST